MSVAPQDPVPGLSPHAPFPSPTTPRPARSQAALRVVSSDVPSPPRPSLSRRELEVLLAWLAADSKSEAADALFITASTVNTHLTRIRAKYAAVGRPARSKANLFARAVQDGHTRLDDW